ncbi:MAG TPA: hypothetical protein VGB55_04455, partial [Tepidisphaeraceae bacterium]
MPITFDLILSCGIAFAAVFAAVWFGERGDCRWRAALPAVALGGAFLFAMGKLVGPDLKLLPPVVAWQWLFWGAAAVMVLACVEPALSKRCYVGRGFPVDPTVDAAAVIEAPPSRICRQTTLWWILCACVAAATALALGWTKSHQSRGWS